MRKAMAERRAGSVFFLPSVMIYGSSAGCPLGFR